MKSRKAFTLIELLVVVAIIALLIALLLPAMAKAKEEAKIVKCGGNLHEIAIALATYATQEKDLLPCVDPCYLPQWNNGNQLMGWADQLYVDGCFQEHTDQNGVGGAQGDGTQQNNGASWHYPSWGYGMMQCPSHSATVELDSNGQPSDARYNQGYALAWCARSGWYASAGNGGPWSFEMRNLNPQHIMATEASGGMAAASAYPVPAHMNLTASPGYYQYGIFERHVRNNTKGANYLFADSHVEFSSDYGWAPSAYNPYSALNWNTHVYTGPSILPNGHPNTMMKSRVWAHGASDN